MPTSPGYWALSEPVTAVPPAVEPPAVLVPPAEPPARAEPPAADEPPAVDPPAVAAPPALDPPAVAIPPALEPPAVDPPAEPPAVIAVPPASAPPSGNIGTAPQPTNSTRPRVLVMSREFARATPEHATSNHAGLAVCGANESFVSSTVRGCERAASESTVGRFPRRLRPSRDRLHARGEDARRTGARTRRADDRALR